MTSTTFKTRWMKIKVLFLLALACFTTWSSDAQRGVRIGYIDTEYILQNVPEYQQASSQLDAKVQKWKTEIEQRLSTVEQKKKQLSTESVLLTRELIEEREEDIQVEENEILDYQQKRFGPNGDLMIQKKQLMQPIQDQIFAAVQEIAANKKYDFVFDKSADVVMLFSANRFDISDLVLRSITRASKRKQATNRKERKKAEEEDVVPVINKDQEARAQALADKKAAREKAVADRKAKQLADREAKKKALAEKKQKIIEARKKAREAKIKERQKDNDTVSEETTTAKETAEDKTPDTENKTVDKKAGETTKDTAPKTTAKSKQDAAKDKAAKRLSEREARKKALEEKKRKIIEARKAKLAAKKKQDSIAKAEKQKKLKGNDTDKNNNDN